VERPKEGEVAQIEDSYAYNGDGLRMSQTISKTTTYMAWDTSGKLAVLLNDGTNNYVYGPADLPIEQINSEGKVLYLHHDQQGSTRLLTSATGSIEATFTYDAYGNQTGHTGTAATPLGYDGEYTDSDTGLIYLRARYYDPTTAQFLNVDKIDALTHQPYEYANNDPLANDDPSGENYVNWWSVHQATNLQIAILSGSVAAILSELGPVGEALGILGQAYLEIYLVPKLEDALPSAQRENEANERKNRKHIERRQSPNQRRPWGVTISIHTVLGGHHHDVPNGVIGVYVRQNSDAPPIRLL
jgi:RHS repeat-associated protein